MTHQPELPPEHYETVLRYMEAANEEDFDTAVQTLTRFNFNIHNAINARFGTPDPTPAREVPLQRRDEDQQVELRRYMQFLREKQASSVIGSIYAFLKSLVGAVFKGIAELIFPEVLLGRFIRSAFYNSYSRLVGVKVIDKPLDSMLSACYMSRKPIMFCVASPNGRHQSFLTLLTTPNIVKKIGESFFFAGAMIDDPQCNRIEGQKQPPSIVILRQNIFEKLEVTHRFVGEDQIRAIDVNKLNQAIRTHQRACRRDRNIAVRYRNYIKRTYYARPGIVFEEEEEEELLPEWQTSSSEMIKFQNEEYNKVKEEAMKKQQEEIIEKKKEDEVVEERRARKMSIPDEPTDGDIVRINFRCPDGTTITRNFSMDDKLEMIYAWVETNDELQFEDNKLRKFELLHSYPPAALCGRKDEQLRDIFDFDQEKLMIREL